MITRYDALGLIAIKSNGRTNPLIIECEYVEENIPSRKSLLVKVIGLPEIIPSALYCEVLGNLIARELGIETPEPFIVDLSDEFVKSTSKILLESSIKIVSGLAAGCEYFSQGFVSVKSDMYLKKEQFEQAVMIYGLDLVIQNSDRLETNPNCAFKGERIIAFDFEKSLSFIYPIFGAKTEPWEFSKLNLTGNRKHIFANSLKSKANQIDWQPFVQKVKRITNKKLEELCSFVPIEFGDHTNEVCRHFTSIVSNEDQLVFELQRSLL